MDIVAQRTKYESIQKDFIEIIAYHNMPVSQFYMDKLTTTTFDNFKFWFPWFAGTGSVDDKLKKLSSSLGIKLSNYEPELVAHIHDNLEWLIVLSEL